MKTLFVFALLLFQNQVSGGYYLTGENLVFVYSGEVRESIYVSGNFNSWAKTGEEWKMKFDKESGQWRLQVSRNKIKNMANGFYEFTFRIDGKLIDANKEQANTIHCAGYGYRYVIKNL